MVLVIFSCSCQYYAKPWAHLHIVMTSCFMPPSSSSSCRWRICSDDVSFKEFVVWLLFLVLMFDCCRHQFVVQSRKCEYSRSVDSSEVTSIDNVVFRYHQHLQSSSSYWLSRCNLKYLLYECCKFESYILVVVHQGKMQVFLKSNTKLQNGSTFDSYNMLYVLVTPIQSLWIQANLLVNSQIVLIILFD